MRFYAGSDEVVAVCQLNIWKFLLDEMLHYTKLYYTTLHYTTIHHTVPQHNTQPHTSTHYTTLYTTLYYTRLANKLHYIQRLCILNATIVKICRLSNK